MTAVVGIHCSMRPDGSMAQDGNTAILRQDGMLAALCEERATRRKYDGQFATSYRILLESMELTASDVDAVFVSTFNHGTEDSDDTFAPIVSAISVATGVAKSRVHCLKSHHLAHAAGTAAYLHGKTAIIAVLDNEGSVIGKRDPEAPNWRQVLEGTSFYLWQDGQLRLLARSHDRPGVVNFGKAYSKVTRYVGFGSYQEAGKTMGLAAFGRSARLGLPPLFSEDGTATSTMRNSENWLVDVEEWLSANGVSPPGMRRSGEPIRRFDADLAAWMQDSLEIAVISQLRYLASRENVQVVALAGGVAMNSVLNGRLRRALPGTEIFVPPAPGDSGLGLGAIAAGLMETGRTLPTFDTSPYLGPLHPSLTLESVGSTFADRVVCRRVDDPVASAAKDIADGHLIGWHQGRSEFGPRALGNRSILANPSNPWTVSILNEQVKMREWFRPYAPVVPLERVSDYFEDGEPVPYMMHVSEAKRLARQVMPAGVHVDGTARLQTVSARGAPEFAALLLEVERLTGHPLLLNTSFNGAGEPIVETPADAIRTFADRPVLDKLYVGDLEFRHV